MTPPALVEHFFRREYGWLVAVLSRRVGVQYIEAVEDAVQSALMTALESWTRAGEPTNPSAWLFRVANNEPLDELRQRARHGRILEQKVREGTEPPWGRPEVFLAGEVRDDLLRMLFVCCDPTLSGRGTEVGANLGHSGSIASEVPYVCGSSLTPSSSRPSTQT